VTPGRSATLSVEVTSLSGNPTFQWYHSGKPIPGATHAQLQIAPATEASAGWYYVTASDWYGTKTSPTAFVQIAPERTSLAIFGTPYFDVLPPLAEFKDPILIAASTSHALALLRDGTVKGWGPVGETGTAVPNGLADVVAIAAGVNRSLALKADGTIVAWGADPAFRTVPAEAMPAVGIAVVGQAACAWKADGSAYSWGNTYYYGPLPHDASDYSDMVGQGTHAIIRLRDGRLTEWGEPWSSFAEQNLTPDGTRLATSGWMSFIVTPDGTLKALNIIPLDPRGTRQPANLGPVKTAAVGYAHVAAITTGGLVRCWGDNAAGQYPAALPTDEFFWSAASDGMATLLVRDDSTPYPPSVVEQPIDCTVRLGQTAQFTARFAGRPAPLTHWQVRFPGDDWIDLADNDHVEGTATPTLAIKNATWDWHTAQIRCIGSNGVSQASTSASLRIDRRPLVTLAQPRRLVCTFGQRLDLIATAAGEGPFSYQWYFRGFAVPGATSPSMSVFPLRPENTGWYQIKVTNSFGTTTSDAIHVLGRTAFPAAIGWDLNEVAPPPADLGAPILVASGPWNFAAITADGEVRTWSPPHPYHAPPAVPPTATDAVALLATDTYHAVLRSDGTLVANDPSFFVPASELPTDIVQFSGNDECLLAVRRDGTVCAARASYIKSSTAAVPADLADVVAVATGYAHAAALCGDGHIRMWGDGTLGQLAIPPGLEDVVAIAAGHAHTLALRRDGTVVAWGDNSSGQCTAPRDLGDIIAIAAGGASSAALRRDGRLYLWGVTASIASLPSTGYASSVAVGERGGCAIMNSPIDPIVLVNPTDVAVTAPTPAKFAADAYAIPATFYRWQRADADGVTWHDLPESTLFHGVTEAELRIQPTVFPLNGTKFRCVITNGAGSETPTTSAILAAQNSFEGYRCLHLLSDLDQPSISAPEADPDSDRLPNIVEYAFGLDPLVPDLSSPLKFLWTAASLQISYSLDPSATDIACVLQVSNDLETWTTLPNPIGQDESAAARSATVSTGSSDRLFFRLQVTQR
jgi:alpha-tubulin suppressor-like RCC1 family protein